MIKYPKISAPFKRDVEGTKKLVYGSYINPTVEYIADCKWICTEKIDGTNIGIMWDGHNVSFQGRTERAQLPVKLAEKLIELFGGNANEEVFEQLFGENEVILFGEGYGSGIQGCGSLYRSDVSFILFDVYFPQKDLWLERKNVENIAKALNIEVVPVILEGTLKEAVEYVKTKPNSTIGTAKMEGLVCRPALEIKDRRNERLIVKVKVCDFEGVSK